MGEAISCWCSTLFREVHAAEEGLEAGVNARGSRPNSYPPLCTQGEGYRVPSSRVVNEIAAPLRRFLRPTTQHLVMVGRKT